jgi:hypothetical protein
LFVLNAYGYIWVSIPEQKVVPLIYQHLLRHRAKPR